MVKRSRESVDLIRRALPFDEWPPEDQRLWNEATRTGDLFTDAGAAANWRPATLKSYQYAHGRWLRFVARHHPELLEQAPSERLNRRNVLEYVDTLKDQKLNPTTIWGYINELNNVAYRLMPDREWDWLRQIANRLHLTVRPRPYLETQLVSIQELYQAGLTLIEQSQSSKPRRRSCIHVDYRDGLMIALLASMPVRLQNFANIEIGRHLVKTPEGYSLIFPEDEVKNRQHIEVEVYEPLVPIIDRYLTIHRPELLAGNQTEYLWVSKAGQRVLDHHVSKRVTKVTLRELGKPISPHLFRHCAATSIAEASPELARIIRPLLAHTTAATGERYYNRASVLRASQRHTDALQGIRDSLSELDMDEVA